MTPNPSPPSPPLAYASVALVTREPSQQPCSWAACRDVGTAVEGEWWFCDRHHRQHLAIEAGDDPDDDDPLDGVLVDETAVTRRSAGDHTVTLNRAEAAEAFRRLNAEGLSAQQIADRLGTTQRTVVRWRTDRHTPISLPGVSMTTPVPNTIGLLLEQASGHGSGKVQRLGSKIEGLLDDLRVLMKESEAQEVARQEVARLERQLAEAKARMRGKPTAVPSGPREDSASGINRNLEPLECRKGCGKISAGAQGRAGHERFCQHVAVAS